MEDNRRWFAYDSDSGFEEFDSAEAAKASAEKLMEYWKDEAGDGWADESLSVCWGEIRGHAEITSEREPSEADCVPSHCDIIQEREIVNYKQEYRCNICGGVVHFDGTPPSVHTGPGGKQS